jgi:hypothetical protein
MVERQLPKLHTWVRFPSPAPILSPKMEDGFAAGFAESVLFSVLLIRKKPLGSHGASGRVLCGGAILRSAFHASNAILDNFVPLHIPLNKAFDTFF